MLVREEFGLDLGTATVTVYAKGRGIILREPAMVAIDCNTRNIIAVGEEAKRMQGKTPAHIQTMRPLRTGVIDDLDVTERMIRYFLHKVSGRKLLMRPDVVLCLPSTINDVEKKPIIDAVLDAGARHTRLLDSAVAGAMGAGLDVSNEYGHMIANIGGGVTDLAVVSLGQTVVRANSQICGDSLDDTIMNYLRKKYNLLVGERTAEQLKISIGTVAPAENMLSMDAVGRDYVSRLPKTVRIHSQDICEALEEQINKLAEDIHSLLEHTPPEFAADIFEHGIYLMGGSAQLAGLESTLTAGLQIPCHLVEDPQTSVVRGAGIALESEKNDRSSVFDELKAQRKSA